MYQITNKINYSNINIFAASIIKKSIKIEFLFYYLKYIKIYKFNLRR